MTIYRVQSVERVFDILEVLAGRDSEKTQIEIANELELPKSTVHRLLGVLERRGWVEKSSQNGKYRLGLRLFELGSRAVAHLNFRDLAHPYLEQLVGETGETSHLCVLDRGEVVYLEKVESPRTVRIPSSVGRRNPAYCTSVGKVLLAFLPEQKQEEILHSISFRKYTANTITSLEKLRKELARVRQRGYAVDNEEIEEGLKCIGAPVLDYSGRVVASLSIAGPAFRVTPKEIPALAESVQRVAGELSAELGYKGNSRTEYEAPEERRKGAAR